jgi:hypothetical protein
MRFKMEVIRKLTKVGTYGRSLMIPSIFLEHYRTKNNGKEINSVKLDIQENRILITPHEEYTLTKKKTKK